MQDFWGYHAPIVIIPNILLDAMEQFQEKAVKESTMSTDERSSPLPRPSPPPLRRVREDVMPPSHKKAPSHGTSKKQSSPLSRPSPPPLRRVREDVMPPSDKK